MTTTNIRPATPDDFPAIVEIYNHYIQNTAITFDLEPYTAESRMYWFEQFQITCPPAKPETPRRYQLLIAERIAERDVKQDAPVPKQILGYACSAQLRIKAAYDPSVETSIYLAPNETGLGLGPKLYSALFDSLANQDIHRAFAGVTLPNEASIKLHESFNFKRCGTWSQVGRKFDKYWDVAWYEKEIK